MKTINLIKKLINKLYFSVGAMFVYIYSRSSYNCQIFSSPSNVYNFVIVTRIEHFCSPSKKTVKMVISFIFFLRKLLFLINRFQQDISALSDENFNVVDWVNSTLAKTNDQQNKEVSMHYQNSRKESIKMFYHFAGDGFLDGLKASIIRSASELCFGGYEPTGAGQHATNHERRPSPTN